LGMYIWVDQITGQKPHDLDLINGLNHYIGMQEIVPDAVPELRFMPVISGALLAFGVVAALVGRRSLLFAWVGVFVVVALLGLVDIWLWGYNYGHNLDPTAAIKVPGMSYQPPVIGSKRLLNFRAASWPSVGGWSLVVSVLIGLWLSVREFRRAKTAAHAT
ncbi:MAG: hypothetical protein HKM89_10580, partial [Gemmatimonadales bacterium]|nr:hypothetical protein [Gemmatimonadales bacterium]